MHTFSWKAVPMLTVMFSVLLISGTRVPANAGDLSVDEIVNRTNRIFPNLL